MRLHFGPQRLAVGLASTQRYVAERLFERMLRLSQPYWINVEGQLIRLHTDDMLLLACDIVTAEHNAMAWDAPEEDGFEREMVELEARARARADASSSDSEASQGRVTPSEDMVYEREVYM